ncbi:uncharacterized protein THITE_2107922 [Thermothielavioides terrestris NRRL 8126]|uniref:IkappaB kinase n=1 Tax=Thermothielavioides terrestris (strain ATCC 38088 / NRRL 8126) TaxID=578455 RepID=G2QW95_THETT|nr:uncharacterized protein THITE_2107922 [Thermothielavioides terrestris NRRL 8126]AEO63070.1 hypothetical protein THITE_2107922 [Thermothielavioides terrestris NRRL 8126]
MEDTDLIACVYPFEDTSGFGRKAIEADKNQLRLVPAQLPVEVQHDRPEPQYTEPRGEANVPAYLHGPGLELRFSQGPRMSTGFVFGCGPDCDIVLPPIRGISVRHFALTFDDKHRPIVKDLETSMGTEVIYDRQGHGRRSGFVWIVGGHDILRGKTIVVNVNRVLKFQIVVNEPALRSKDYINNVSQFWQGSVDAENLLDSLGLRTQPPTERGSGIQTPGTGSIFLEKDIGEGSFGVVRYLWNVSTGEECVIKQPSQKAIRERRVNPAAWEREASIMKRISHDHVVKLLGAEFVPLPQFRLEYVRGGSLDNYDEITTSEGLQILEQCLSALAYLHGRDPPIVHRDIKPSNILVQHRRGGEIFVKFGDFGLSREGYDPTTICGTEKYLAPEIFVEWGARNAQRPDRSYTAAVDIWSLGVSVFECVSGRLSAAAGGISWCRHIIKKLKRDFEKDPEPLKHFLLDNMVILRPEKRKSAQYCYEKVLHLTGQAQDDSPTPTATSFSTAATSRQDAHTIAGTRSSTTSGENSADTVLAYTSPEASSPDAHVSRLPTFHESWLLDPLHPFGGGSSLAALLGQETSDVRSKESSSLPTEASPQPHSGGPEPVLQDRPSFWTAVPPPAVRVDQHTRKRSKRSTRSSHSASSSSRRRHPKRRELTASARRQRSSRHAGSSRTVRPFHLDQHRSASQGLLPQVGNWKDPWEAAEVQPGLADVQFQPEDWNFDDLDWYIQPADDPLAVCAPVSGTNPPGRPREGDNGDGSGTDSEAQMAALLLCGMRQQS